MSETRHLFSKVGLSRIKKFAQGIENTQIACDSKFVFYSVALEENTDITDTAWLSIFISD